MIRCFRNANTAFASNQSATLFFTSFLWDWLLPTSSKQMISQTMYSKLPGFHGKIFVIIDLGQLRENVTKIYRRTVS